MAAREVVGIVLGAGDGQRMGGSKALLLASGEPLAAAHARRMHEAGVSRVVIVVRPLVAARLGAVPGAQVLVSSAPDPAGSLSVAMRGAAIAEDALVLVTPVDAAPAARTTIEHLVAALDEGAASSNTHPSWTPSDLPPTNRGEDSHVAREIVPKTPPPGLSGGGWEGGRAVDLPCARRPLAATPRHDGKSGHPILCRAAVLARYGQRDAQDAPPPLRDVLRALGDGRVRVDVDDPLVLVDLDTPDDVLAWTGHAPRFLGE